MAPQKLFRGQISKGHPCPTLPNSFKSAWAAERKVMVLLLPSPNPRPVLRGPGVRATYTQDQEQNSAEEADALQGASGP